MKDIIIFSSIDWTDNWQAHQELCLFFKGRGDRVLFVENTGSRRAMTSDYKRILSRIKNWINSVGGFRLLKNGITLLSPLFFPFPYSNFFLRINKFFLISNLKKWMSINNYNNPIVITFLPTPLIQNIIKDLNPGLKIFYYADNISEGSKLSRYSKKWETKIIKESDLLSCTSTNLERNIKDINSSYIRLSAGVNFNKFEINRKNYKNLNILKKYNKPIIGYIGAISTVFDVKLVLDIADHFKNATVVLVGPVYININSLKKKNIIIEGQKNFEEIIKYYFSFNIGIVPYKVNEYTNSVYPTKLNEYLAAGIPVVSTNFFEAEKFCQENHNLISVAKTNKEFIQKIEYELSEFPNKQKEEKLLQIAQNNNWQTKFEKLNLTIEKSVLEKKLKYSDTISLLKNELNIIKRNILSFFVLPILILGIIFYTPLIDLLSKPLILPNVEKKVDAIVVFSGHGEIDYSSFEYRERSKQAIVMYKKNIAEKVILSSGKHMESIDVSIMEALLFKEISKEKIDVLKTFPASTFENVQMVNNVLKMYGYKSIILITEPLHSRRAYLTWKKVNPDIKVNSFSKSNRNKFIYLNFTKKIERMRIILHECMALLHNYYNDRI